MERKKFRLYSPGEYNIMNFDKLRYDLTSFLALELQKKYRTMLYPLARYRIYSAQHLWYEGVFNSSVDVYRIAFELTKRYRKLITPTELYRCHTIEKLTTFIMKKM